MIPARPTGRRTVLRLGVAGAALLAVGGGLAAWATAGYASLLDPTDVPVALSVKEMAVARALVDALFPGDDGFPAGIALGLGFVASLVPAIIHGLTIGWDIFFHAAIGFSVSKASPASQPLLRSLLKSGVALALFCIDHVFLLVTLLSRIMFPYLRPALAPEWFLWLWLLSAGLGIAAGGSWWSTESEASCTRTLGRSAFRRMGNTSRSRRDAKRGGGS